MHLARTLTFEQRLRLAARALRLALLRPLSGLFDLFGIFSGIIFRIATFQVFELCAAMLVLFSKRLLQ